MNYNDSILENKTFSFVKQLIYNIALSVCILLLIALVLVYGFKFQLYTVLSNSEYPYFAKGDMIVVKEQKEYKIGDIIQFDYNIADPVAHRLIAIKTDTKTNTDYYICHGDNVGSANPNVKGTVHWKEDAEYLKNFTYEQIVSSDSEVVNIQCVPENKIMGKALCKFKNFGDYFNMIKENKYVVITLIIGIWTVFSTIQNEIEMNKLKRFKV